MAKQSTTNQEPNIIKTSLKVAINPFIILQGLREIFSIGDLRYKIAISTAVAADVVTFLIRIAQYLTLGGLLGYLEPFEGILCSFLPALVLFLTGFMSWSLLLEFIPVLPIDVLPIFSTIVLKKWQVEAHTIQNKPTPGSALTAGTGTSFFTVIILMGIAFIGLSFFIGFFNILGLGGVSTTVSDLPGQAAAGIGTAIEEAPTTTAKISIWLKNAASFPRRWWDRQYAIATGDIYTGQIDRYADKDLGVFLKDIEPGEKYFYLGEPGKNPPTAIQIFGRIEGESLEVDDCEDYLTEKEIEKLFTERKYDEEEQKAYYEEQNRLYKNKKECQESQKVEMGCQISNSKIRGEIEPSDIDLFDIQGGGTAIDCTFDDSRLEKGTEMVDVELKFPFVTKSYIKTYFMDVQRFRDMKRQKLEPLTHYQIKDKKPSAVYTGGPIMIGLGFEDDLPLTVNTLEAEQRSYRVGITLENKWKGKIAEITDLKVIVPKELIFQCPLFEADEEDKTLYTLNEVGKKQIKNSGITSVKTYNCRLSAENAAAARKLLNNIPLITKYVKVTAKYKYELEESTTLKLKQGDGITGDLNDCNTHCIDFDGCYCNKDCKDHPLEVSSGYNCDGDYDYGVLDTLLKAATSDTDSDSVSSTTTPISGSNLKVLSRLGSPSPMEQTYGTKCDKENYPIQSFPVIGDMRLNPKAADAFKAALQAIEDDGYGDLIRIRLGHGWGHYSCRDARGSSTRSAHAWGVAIDINVRMGPNAKRSGGTITDYDELSGTNYGVDGVYEPLKFLADNYFIPAGIAWGGYWGNPDPMHFEAT